MHDVLKSPLSREELEAALRRELPLLPPAGAAEWSAAEHPLLRETGKDLLAAAEREAGEPLPVLDPGLYGEFYRSGERLAFERIYFERRRRLGRAALAVLLDRSGRFLDSLVTKIGETLAEESWALPAHVTHPSGMDPRVIDLCAAETANTMGEMVSLFRLLLPEKVMDALRDRLQADILENYLERHREFVWTSAGMNWNAVCHQGVLGAALAVDTPRAARILEIAQHALPRFLDGFGDDGSTSEGPLYWQYGFGHFSELNAQLEARSAGALSLFGCDEKIRRIAVFAQKCIFRNGYAVNFSDGPREGMLHPALLAYLGERLDIPALTAQAGVNYARLARSGAGLHTQRADAFHLVRLFLRCPHNVPSGEPEQSDVFFPNYGAVVARGEDREGNRWEFAAKAGNNHEHHNHNDCGSFLLNINGTPAIVEIGAPEYVRAYFGPERYTFLAARSLGHSVPFVNGCEQAAGAEFAARVLRCVMEDERVEFAVDLSRCYPAEARCGGLVREFILDKRGGLLRVTDRFELGSAMEFESMVIVEAPVCLSGSDVEIQAAGAVLRLQAHEGCAFTEVEELDYRANGGIPAKVRRIRLAARPCANGAAGFTVTVP